MIINNNSNKSIVFFTGAGMSAESDVPVYRGNGGIWNEYDWEEYACQKAFDTNPEKVLDFHEVRRKSVLACKPHIGHEIISNIEKQFRNFTIITQNIDGIHQQAGSKNVIELHGSLWRLRCELDNKVFIDMGETYTSKYCDCGGLLRPDITWFEDSLNKCVFTRAIEIVDKCDLFVSIGTSAIVHPASKLPLLAIENGAYTIEINPEQTSLSCMYDETLRLKATDGLKILFNYII